MTRGREFGAALRGPALRAASESRLCVYHPADHPCEEPLPIGVQLAHTMRLVVHRPGHDGVATRPPFLGPALRAARESRLCVYHPADRPCEKPFPIQLAHTMRFGGAARGPDQAQRRRARLQGPLITVSASSFFSALAPK